VLKKINFLLTKRDKIFLLVLLIFSVIVSLIETVGIGIIMPFIKVASDFSYIHLNKLFENIYNWFHFKNEVNFVIFFGILLIMFYVLRGFINMFYIYLLNRFSFGRYHLIAFKLFENYMGLSYEKFINKNSSLMIKSIINDTYNVVQIISSLLFMISEFFVMIFIYFMLIYVNWKMTILLTLYLLINIIFLKKFITKKIKNAGEERDFSQSKYYDILNSSFGNFKIIKLKNKDKNVLDEFAFASSKFANANIKNQTLSQFPRLFLEMIGFSLVAFIIIYLVLKYQTDIKEAIPILSVFVLGLYRLLPSVNRIFSAYNSINFYLKSLNIIHNELIYEPENLGDEKIDFKKEIKLKDVNFSYGKKEVLKNINLNIKKGEKLGIIGESGSGKSTLIDLIIGLYKPKSGKIFVDEVELNEKNIKSWRKKIGYIPQMIYLKDGSVAENVAFLEEIDEKKVKEALKRANILNFLEKYHEGIYTHIGENGIKLSGGQRQRIAIARALYNNPEILVLDEATSALDNETESKIMNEIYKIGENKTMIIVAHRLSTLDKCDRIIKLENGMIKG
jgi:ABC-type multidrug transport system fused ATPase/permease subunit